MLTRTSEMGLPVTVVLDTRTAQGELDELRKLGARIVMVTEPRFVLARIEEAKEIAASAEGLVDRDDKERGIMGLAAHPRE